MARENLKINQSGIIYIIEYFVAIVIRENGESRLIKEIEEIEKVIFINYKLIRILHLIVWHELRNWKTIMY